MASTTFVDQVTPVPASWLNDVNNAVYNGIIGAQTISYSDTGIAGTYASTVAGYSQVIIQNKSAATNASANINISNNSGTATTNFIEMGINSSTFTGTGSFNQAGNSYVASSSTDLVIGTYAAKPIRFVYNNSATASVTIDSNGLNSSTFNSGFLYGNRVINGAMEIDQVNGGSAITPTANAYLTDMFGNVISQASKLTYQQVTDAPAGLLKSLKITVAAQYTPIATDQFTLLTAVEGKDVIDFKFGTSGAATITLSNQIKGSIAGTYTVSIRNAAANRSYVGIVSVTTSWTPVQITLIGDLSGIWLTDNTIGMSIAWDLGSGSNYNTTAGLWQAGNFTRTSGSVTFVNQVVGSTLNITGVDCRLGSITPTVFERRSNELQLCQRYFVKTFQQSTAPAQNSGTAGALYAVAMVTNLPVTVTWSFPVTMRVPVPTLTTFNVSAANANWSANPSSPIVVIANISDASATISSTGANTTAGNGYYIQATASARLF